MGQTIHNWIFQKRKRNIMFPVFNLANQEVTRTSNWTSLRILLESSSTLLELPPFKTAPLPPYYFTASLALYHRMRHSFVTIFLRGKCGSDIMLGFYQAQHWLVGCIFACLLAHCSIIMNWVELWLLPLQVSFINITWSYWQRIVLAYKTHFKKSVN